MILQIIPPNSGFDINYRAIWPSKKVNFQFLNVNENSEASFELSEIASILYLFNPLNLEYLSILKRRKLLGLPTIIEYTDNFLELPLWNPARATYGTRKGKSIFRKFIKEATVVTTTSVGFKEYLDKEFTLDAVLLKNQLPENPPPIKEKSKEICWGGSTGHMGDLRDFLPILNELNNRFNFEIMGDPSFSLIAPELSFTPGKPYQEYLNWLSDFKIGVIPLTLNPYNRSRSDIKAVEMLSRGVVPICPEGPVYQDIPTPKYKNPQDIVQIATKLLKDSETLNKYSELGLSYVLQNRVDEKEREKFFSSFNCEFKDVEPYNDTPLPLGKLSRLLEAISEAPESRVSLIEEYLSLYPDSLEGRLMYLKALEEDEVRFTEEFENIDREFPDELRHLSFKNKLELLERLEKLSKIERAEVLYQFKDLFLGVTDIDILKRAVKVFGSIHGARLIFELANNLQKQGESEEAKVLYKQLYSIALSFYPILPVGFPNFQLITCLAKD